MRLIFVGISMCLLAGFPAAAQSPVAPATGNAGPETRQGPLAGANTFSEQAIRGRLEGAGFTRVMGLQLDQQGIWRATAMRNKAMVPVAIDYRMEIFEG